MSRIDMNYFGMPTELLQLGFNVEIIPMENKLVPLGKMLVFKEEGKVYINYKSWYRIVYFIMDFNRATEICLEYAKNRSNRFINEISVNYKIYLDKYNSNEMIWTLMQGNKIIRNDGGEL